MWAKCPLNPLNLSQYEVDRHLQVEEGVEDSIIEEEIAHGGVQVTPIMALEEAIEVEVVLP